MTLQIPPGFVAVSVPIRNAAITRAAAVTFGCEDLAVGDPDATANLIQSVFVSTVGARIDASCAIGPVRIAIGQDGGEPVLGFASSSAPGGRALDSLAPALAVLVRKRTSRGGRRGRGAMYLPWAIADNTVTEAGVVSSTEVNAYNLALEAFRNDMASEDLPLVLLHSTGVTPPGDPNPITAMTVEPIISHQVRRQTR